jgi:hypothetical protein
VIVPPARAATSQPPLNQKVGASVYQRFVSPGILVNLDCNSDSGNHLPCSITPSCRKALFTSSSELALSNTRSAILPVATVPVLEVVPRKTATSVETTATPINAVHPLRGPTLPACTIQGRSNTTDKHLSKRMTGESLWFPTTQNAGHYNTWNRAAIAPASIVQPMFESRIVVSRFSHKVDVPKYHSVLQTQERCQRRALACRCSEMKL